MAEIDDVLRSTLSRVPFDADTAGVADAIRARVAAGDPGTTASTSGFRVGFRGWLPLVGLLVVVALLGFGLGVSGVFGQPSVAGSITGRTRPVAQGTPTSAATTTATPTAGAIPTPTVVAPVTPVAPPPPPHPAPSKAKDTTPPTLGVGKPSSDPIWGIGSACPPTSTTIATTAGDASGVASVSAVSSFSGTVISSSGPPSSTVFAVSANELGVAPPFTVTITITATDSAGNSTTRTASFTLFPAGNCVI